MSDALRALRLADFDYTRPPLSVWQTPASHVPDLHAQTLALLVEDFEDGTGPGRPGNPLGRVIVGTAGAGKTHLLGALREQVWRRDGWFVLIDLSVMRDFWDTAALALLDALGRAMPAGGSQGQALLARLTGRGLLPPEIPAVLRLGRQNAIRPGLDGFALAMRAADPSLAMTHGQVLRAFAALQCGNPDWQDAAHGWLLGNDIGAQAAELGLTATRCTPEAAVAGLSWLMAQAGPTLWAIDQLDPIVSIGVSRAITAEADPQARAEARIIIDGLAQGLMALWASTRRSLLVVAALEASWEEFLRHAIATTRDRFVQPPLSLPAIGGEVLAQRIVRERLAPAFREAGFAPPYPTFPFRQEAFAGAGSMTPRELLQACAAHRDLCRRNQAVTELAAFGGGAVSPPGTGARPTAATPPAAAQTVATPTAGGATLEARYGQLRAAAKVAGLLEQEGEAALRDLLVDALRALLKQTPTERDRDLTLDLDTAGLHARLRLTDNAAGGDERHHCFRVLPHGNATAVQNRLREAMSASGIDRNLPARHLILLRARTWPGGGVTARMVAEFEQRGGRVLAPEEADLRRFAALGALLRERPEGLEEWLRRRRPLDESPFFRALGLVGPAPAASGPGAALPGTGPAGAASVDPTPASAVPASAASARTGPASAAPASGAAVDTTPSAASTIPAAAGAAPAAPPTGPASGPAAAPPPDPAVATIPLGLRLADGQPVTLPLMALRRHALVVAGAGSGKTVLLKRLVEEAALQGVPAILLDSNNDLVTLADSWPTPPAAFTDTDRAKAERFHRAAEVVTWTPGRPDGNPISLAPLPDFAALAGEPVEVDEAVTAAHETLCEAFPGAGAGGRLQSGVVMDALRHFARAGGGSLDAFIALLQDLPPEVSRQRDAAKLAAKAADQLLAARSLNPLLAAEGTPLDPALLLRGPAGRTRISVVNLGGLASEAAREGFVARLLLALFGHIKRAPAGPGQPLLGLLVVDEAHNFAPSRRSATCGAAMVALVKQARKYGLGVLFATQMPKDITHDIVNNCATLVFGRTSSPAALEAAREMLAARGGEGRDLGTLERGVFYASGEGVKPQKLRAPLCLSHHPDSPPPQEAVVARARAGRG